MPEFHNKCTSVTKEMMDHFFFGNKDLMKNVMSMYNNIGDLLKNSDCHSTEGLIYEYIIQNKLFIKQQGAGNGKTWGIINMIGREDFSHYTKFIYVTKQHSARNIIKEEFTNQQSQLNISNVKYKDLNKKYIIEYTNNKDVECSIIIATIDSFMYAVGSKTENSYDMFEGIVNSIKNNHIETDIKGTINFATINPKLNSETLYIVDETQDLSQMYAEAIVKIMEHTHIDVYVVGDKLQSISNEINAFNYFIKYPNAIIEEPINICRRFTDPVLVNFVNHMIPFNNYDLLPVTPWKHTEQERIMKI